MEPRKLPVVAIVLASAALVVAIVAVGILATRGDAPKPALAEQPPDEDGKQRASLVDVTVEAELVAKLAEGAAPLGSRGSADGFEIADDQLRKALALEKDDAIVAFNGRELKRANDLRDAMMDASLARVSTIYVEVKRGKDPVLLRWRVTGDLRRAYFDRDRPSARLAPPPDPFSVPDPSVAPDPNAALLDQIVKVDDTHVNVPQAVIDAMVANPAAFSKGARVVPSMKNGAPNGFKLYAIRPSSPYARMGFTNGDTLKSINGFELTSLDKALEVYAKLHTTKKFVIEIERRGHPETLHISIVK